MYEKFRGVGLIFLVKLGKKYIFTNAADFKGVCLQICLENIKIGVIRFFIGNLSMF